MIAVSYSNYPFTWHTLDAHIHKIQVLKNRILRMAIHTQWYVKNTTIHRDIKLPFIGDTLHKHIHGTMVIVHLNPFIRHSPLSMPPAIQHRHLRRNRYTEILTQVCHHNGDCCKTTTSHSSDTWLFFTYYTEQSCNVLFYTITLY